MKNTLLQKVIVPNTSFPLLPFSNRTLQSYSWAGVQLQTTFPASLAAMCSSVTKSQPMGCKQK